MQRGRDDAAGVSAGPARWRGRRRGRAVRDASSLSAPKTKSLFTISQGSRSGLGGAGLQGAGCIQ